MILDVSVEELKPRDVIQLPSGRRVTVDRIDVCGDSRVVRWWRRAEYGEVGARTIAGVGDGHYLGSLVTAATGDTVRVVKGG
jgi:hypothetical protein